MKKTCALLCLFMMSACLVQADASLPAKITPPSPTVQWLLAQEDFMQKIEAVKAALEHWDIAGPASAEASARANKAQAIALAALRRVLEKEAPVLCDLLRATFKERFERPDYAALTEHFERWYPSRTFLGGTMGPGYNGVWW